VNDRKRAAFLADLAVLVHLVEHPDTEYKIPAFAAADLRLDDWQACGFPSGGGNGGRSSGVSDPTSSAVIPPRKGIGHQTRQDPSSKARHDFDYHASMAAFHVKKLAAIVGRAHPVPAVAEPPVYPCQNIDCTHVCLGVGDDRLVRPTGQDQALCPKCRVHWVRHKTPWPKRADGTDVRGTLAPLAKDGAP
jgi:hypothetical protein